MTTWSREGHDLAVHLVGRVFHCDVIAEALAHLLDAVSAHQDWHHKALLRCLPHHLLELAAHQQVEFLVRAAELHVGFNDHRVVGLEKGVEQLGHGDGPVGLEPVGKVGSVQELSDCEAAGETKHVGQRELTEPFTLPHGFGPVLVDNLEELAHVGLGVGHHLGMGEHGAGGRFTAWVAYLGCPVAHDEDDVVSQVLQLPELSKPHHVAQVDVRPAGVEPIFRRIGLPPWSRSMNSSRTMISLTPLLAIRSRVWSSRGMGPHAHGPAPRVGAVERMSWVCSTSIFICSTRVSTLEKVCSSRIRRTNSSLRGLPYMSSSKFRINASMVIA